MRYIKTVDARDTKNAITGTAATNKGLASDKFWLKIGETSLKTDD